MAALLACAACGTPTRGTKYCHQPECRAVGKKNAAEATRTHNLKRWARWRELGIDPSHGGAAAASRGHKMTLRNERGEAGRAPKRGEEE